jgi:hypothetical protein
VLAQITPRDLEQERGEEAAESRGVSFNMLIMSPDGKYLFCEGRQSMHRLKIVGNRVVPTMTRQGRARRQSRSGSSVSGDARYVAMPSGGGNAGIEGMPKTNYATYVFRATDLKKPVMTIESGAYPRTLAFDAVASASTRRTTIPR